MGVGFAVTTPIVAVGRSVGEALVGSDSIRVGIGESARRVPRGRANRELVERVVRGDLKTPNFVP